MRPKFLILGLIMGCLIGWGISCWEDRQRTRVDLAYDDGRFEGAAGHPREWNPHSQYNVDKFEAWNRGWRSGYIFDFLTRKEKK